MNDEWNEGSAMGEDGYARAEGSGDHGTTITALRELFAGDAAGVDATADAWSRFEMAREHQPRLRVLRTRRVSVVPLAAVAVAATIAVLIGVLIRSPESAVETNTPATTPPTTPASTRATTPSTGPSGVVEVPGTGATEPPPINAPATTAAPANRSVRTIDLNNATYPAELCPGVHSSSIVMRDGVGGDPDSNRGEATRGAYLRRDDGLVSYGDVNGDGVEDVAVIIDCAWHRTDDHTAAVAVMTVRNGVLVPVTSIVDARIEQAETVHTVNPDDDRSPVVERSMPITYSVASHVEVAAGTVVVTWNTYNIGGVNRQVTGTYRITGASYELVATGEARVVGGQGHLVADAQRYAVRAFDLRSISLALSTGICWSELGPAGSVRDARLTNGSASVVDQSGAAVGTVEVVDVVYRHTKALDSSYDDGQGGSYAIYTDEAFVFLRCTGPLGTRVTVVAVGARDGSPVVLGELMSDDTGVPVWGGPITLAAEEVTVYDDPSTVPEYKDTIEVRWRMVGSDFGGTELRFTNQYRWNGTTFERFR